MRRRLPRVANFVAQAVEFPGLFVGAPLSLSQKGERHGWSADRPGAANLVGVLPLGAGTAMLLWAMSSHYRAAAQGWEISPTPDYLLVRGPYAFTRNPMYLGEAAIWTGWAVLFGSLPVAAGLAAIIVVQSGAVRVEEHLLHKRWGESYDGYRARVPRWLKLPAVSGLNQQGIAALAPLIVRLPPIGMSDSWQQGLCGATSHRTFHMRARERGEGGPASHPGRRVGRTSWLLADVLVPWAS
jgi:protein-S-isoprenylcysteine O-methyltransferase Ste14